MMTAAIVDRSLVEGDRVRLTYGDGSTVEGTWRGVVERDDGELHTHTRGQVAREVLTAARLSDPRLDGVEAYSASLAHLHEIEKLAGALLARSLRTGDTSTRRLAEEYAAECNELSDQLEAWRLSHGYAR